MSEPSRSTHALYYDVEPIRGFTDQQLVDPAFVALLCSEGREVTDLEVTKVIQSPDRNAVKAYMSGIVSALVEIDAASIQGGSTEKDTQSKLMNRVDDAFDALKDPRTSAVLEIPYTDNKGTHMVLIAAATSGKDNTVRVGLHTDLAVSYNR